VSHTKGLLKKFGGRKQILRNEQEKNVLLPKSKLRGWLGWKMNKKGERKKEEVVGQVETC